MFIYSKPKLVCNNCLTEIYVCDKCLRRWDRGWDRESAFLCDEENHKHYCEECYDRRIEEIFDQSFFGTEIRGIQEEK